MATFEEIFTQTAIEIGQEPTDKANVTQALKDYYDAFHPFFALGNGYMRGGLPFFTQSNTLTQLKNQMYNQIENKNTCVFSFELKPKIVLKVRFLVRESLQNVIRIQVVRENSTSSDEYVNQEDAARLLAKIVLKYKD